MNEQQSLPDASFLVVSQMMLASESLDKQGCISSCCGTRALRYLGHLNDSWSKFGMMVGIVTHPKVRIDKIAANREWLVIPDKDGSLVMDWAVADRSLHHDI